MNRAWGRLAGPAKRLVMIAALATLVGGPAGCATRASVSIVDPLAFKSGAAPGDWETTLAARLNRPSALQQQRCKAYVDAVDPAFRRSLRDDIALTLMGWIEEHHQRSRIRLAGVRAAHDAAADLAVIALTTAASLGTGEALKSALAATATAVTGANTAIDDRFLRDQATGAILAQMDADHRAAMLAIRRRLSEFDDAAYPLAAADLDLLQCLYAGTVTSAVASLADEAALRRARMRHDADMSGLPEN